MSGKHRWLLGNGERETPDLNSLFVRIAPLQTLKLRTRRRWSIPAEPLPTNGRFGSVCYANSSCHIQIRMRTSCFLIQPQPVLAAAMRERDIDIGRAHPPYTNWARITIGLPAEHLPSPNALRSRLKE